MTVLTVLTVLLAYLYGLEQDGPQNKTVLRTIPRTMRTIPARGIVLENSAYLCR
jgi:hypothetical protein